MTSKIWIYINFNIEIDKKKILWVCVKFSRLPEIYIYRWERFRMFWNAIGISHYQQYFSNKLFSIYFPLLYSTFIYCCKILASFFSRLLILNLLASFFRCAGIDSFVYFLLGMKVMWSKFYRKIWNTWFWDLGIH